MEDQIRRKVRGLVTEALNDLFLALERLDEDPKEIEAVLWREAPINLPNMWRWENNDDSIFGRRAPVHGRH